MQLFVQEPRSVCSPLALPSHPCFGNDPPDRLKDLISKSRPVVAKILTEARARLAGHKRRHPELTPLLDDSLLIIEDEYGCLWHHEGDLSFLMPETPVLFDNFSAQLNPNSQREYEYAQQAAWDCKIRGNAPFVSQCGRQAGIFQLYPMRQMFTATVFFAGIGPDFF